MHRVDLAYTLAAGERRRADLHHPLLELLEAVDRTGSISAAAREKMLSYRHVWGELKRWESELGRPLLVWTRGQPARLSTFGTKLLWAERQAQARLAPQLASLRNELERAFATAFDDDAEVIAVSASHDEALPLLGDWTARHRKLHLDIQFTGSVDALTALNDGRCLLAGFHALTDAPMGSATAFVYRPLLEPGWHKLIGFARAKPGSHGRRRQPARDSLAGRPRPPGASASSTGRAAPERGSSSTSCWPRPARSRTTSAATTASSRRTARSRRASPAAAPTPPSGSKRRHAPRDSTSSSSPRSATSSRRCDRTSTTRSSPACARCWPRRSGSRRCASFPATCRIAAARFSRSRRCCAGGTTAIRRKRRPRTARRSAILGCTTDSSA